MDRTYKVIDADGHILDPLELWDNYMDPAFLARAPQVFIDEHGRERLRVEGKVVGSPAGIGRLGAIGLRDGLVPEDMKYVDGRKGGFDPHARIVDLDLDGIDAAFLYPSIGLFSGAVDDPALAAAMCRAYNRWLADYCAPYPDASLAWQCCQCNPSTTLSKKCALRVRNLACGAAFYAPILTTTAWRGIAITIRFGHKHRN